MAEGPFGLDPGRGGYTLEPQGTRAQNFFQPGGWGPQVPFGPGHGFGPGPIPWQDPMYRDHDTWGLEAPQRGPANPMHDMLPPMACPQPCPVTVRADLCVPQGPSAAWDSDPFGDPGQFVPPGVRTVPEYTPSGVKKTTGGLTLVGPGGQYVFPGPKLPTASRGTVVASGELVGPPGAVDSRRPLGEPGGIQAAAGGFRMPALGWVALAFVAWKVLGR